MNVTQKEGQTIIELEGRLDAVTSPELTKAIEELSFEKLVIMMDKLEYISSAGLRALLVCQKTVEERQAEMVVRCPSMAVFDVMKMSGFNKVLTIEEA